MDITGKIWKKNKIGDLDFVTICRLADNSFIKYKQQKSDKSWALAVRSYTEEQILKLFGARVEDAKRYSTKAETRAKKMLDSAIQTIARIKSVHNIHTANETRLKNNKEMETK